MQGVEGGEGRDVGADGVVAYEGGGGVEPSGEEMDEAVDVGGGRRRVEGGKRRVSGCGWFQGGSGNGEAGQKVDYLEGVADGEAGEDEDEALR